MIRAWYYNVWQNRKFMLRKVENYTSPSGKKTTREYHFYYCNFWCWLTDQLLCFKRIDKESRKELLELWWEATLLFFGTIGFLVVFIWLWRHL